MTPCTLSWGGGGGEREPGVADAEEVEAAGVEAAEEEGGGAAAAGADAVAVEVVGEAAWVAGDPEEAVAAPVTVMVPMPGTSKVFPPAVGVADEEEVGAG